MHALENYWMPYSPVRLVLTFSSTERRMRCAGMDIDECGDECGVDRLVVIFEIRDRSFDKCGDI